MRNKSLFNKKIRCVHCGSNFKSKKEGRSNKRYVYVCSLYDNKNKCIRNAIREDFLVELIGRRIAGEINKEAIEKHIQMIVVENVNPYLLEIHFYNQESILFSKEFIRF